VEVAACGEKRSRVKKGNGKKNKVQGGMNNGWAFVNGADVRWIAYVGMKNAARGIGIKCIFVYTHPRVSCL